MKKVTQEIYDRIDNHLYPADGDSWWQADSPLAMLQSSVNPARLGYFNKKLFAELRVNPRGKAALEVGCGGGILCEEIARMGFDVTGIDPSEHSLQIATSHAKASDLRIRYDHGTGESLPYLDNTFDIVFCCDVLEHVRDGGALYEDREVVVDANLVTSRQPDDLPAFMRETMKQLRLYLAVPDKTRRLP